MIEVRCYPQKNCPRIISEQIVALLQHEWPHTFHKDRPDWPTETSELQPVSLVLLKDDVVISHAAVLRKKLHYGEEDFAAFGLSSMVTSLTFRRQGLAGRLFKHATCYMKEEQADIGIFTCDPQLKKLYCRCGWKITKTSHFVGGTREKPFPSDKLGKLTLLQFFSYKAKAAKESFLASPIFIELGEGKLW